MMIFSWSDILLVMDHNYMITHIAYVLGRCSLLFFFSLKKDVIGPMHLMSLSFGMYLNLPFSVFKCHVT